MMNELGGFFGWLLVASFVGTILNYCLKFVNKNYGKKISTYPTAKKLMKALITIFVRYHKYFGFTTVVMLLVHFLIQFTREGLNVTGCIAAVVMLLQVLLGVYATAKKKQRKGTWFVIHRVIAVLIICGIALHLLFPYALQI